LRYKADVRSRPRACFFAFAALVFAFSSQAFAQGNDIAAPAGGRATLMGNTGVALGRDGSAPFYNPATIVRIRDESLAFSVNFYSLSLVRWSEWHQPAALDPDRFGQGRLPDASLFDVDFRPLPSTLCLFFTLEELVAFGTGDAATEESSSKTPTGKKLALCFATLESEDFDVQAIGFRTQTPAGPSSHVQSILRRWSRTYVGPTYSVSLNRNFAIGGSLQVVYSWDSFGIHSESLSAQQDGTGVSSTLSTSGSGRAFGLTGTLGATYRMGRVTLGASLRLPSLPVIGDYDGTFTQSYGSGEQVVSTLVDGSGKFKSSPPIRFALGAGLALDRLTLEVNAALELPLQNQLRSELEVTKSTLTPGGVERTTGPENYSVGGRPVINPSFGLEYFLSSGLSLLGGVSANFSSIDALEPVRSVGNMVQAKVNRFGASAGVGSYWNGGELLFGLAFEYGYGRTLAVNPFVVPNDWSIVNMHVYNLLFVIAGSTNLNSIVRMVTAITNGGEVEDKKKAEERADVEAREKAAAEAASDKIEQLINPDAREAEGVDEVPVQPVPESDAGKPKPDPDAESKPEPAPETRPEQAPGGVQQAE
jgi:hypothetical protein